jgi:sporulation protein YlmC with PRC-barrel domain
MAKAKLDKRPIMVRLSDTTLGFANRSEDIRGRTVYDSNREEVGEVDDLFVDQLSEKVRFLQVSSQGFLGLGRTKFLIPVDAITSISEDLVRISQTREQVAGAPAYSPELVDKRFVTNVYDYYGYDPYWEQGYVYPPYPNYPPLL